MNSFANSKPDVQAEIDRVTWYHDLDFGDGLRARSRIENVDGVRTIWRFIEDHLDRVDFAGRSVLEIGAWDGYFSFYAERRGAGSVLATDDVSQNWSSGEGLRLARRLMRSGIDIRQDLSIYELASLKRKFDIVLCLGVFYHLRDPFYGLAQVRHCCHPGSLVILEGELAWTGLDDNEVRYLHNGWLEFLASRSAIETLLRSTYFRLDSFTWMHEAASAPAPAGAIQSDRAIMFCRPYAGANEAYIYRPHFGLDAYDPRFGGSAAERG